MFIKWMSHYQQYSSRDKNGRVWNTMWGWRVMTALHHVLQFMIRGDFIMPRAPFWNVNDCNGIPFNEEIKCWKSLVNWTQ